MLLFGEKQSQTMHPTPTAVLYVYEDAIAINPVFIAYSSYIYYKPECNTAYTRKCTMVAYGSTPRSNVPL